MSNMFEKANEERRKKIIEENIDIAEEVLDSGKSRGNFLLQKPEKKVRRTISLNEPVDNFYSELCEITGISRSNIMENILDISITENREIRELANHNKEVMNLIEKYMDSIRKI